MQRPEVLQQKLEHWCAQSIRSLSNTPTANYRANRLWVNGQPREFRAPYLQLSFDSNNSEDLRGVGDSIALRLLLSDQPLYDQQAPEAPIEKLIFDLLEQARCESLAPDNMPGVRANLKRRFMFWASRNADSELTENNIGILLYTINIVCWARLMKAEIPLIIEDTIEATRYGLASSIGAPLLGISRTALDQKAFGEHSLKIAQLINSMIDQQLDGETRSKTSKLGVSLRQYAKLSKLPLDWLNLDPSQTNGDSSIEAVDSVEGLQQSQYQIFSTEFDNEIEAGNGVRPALLDKLRKQLDARVALDAINIQRVARQLRKLNNNEQLAGWSFGEEGYLDASRLAKLVTSPSDKRLFKLESRDQHNDCIVSILIDNSGSMTAHAEKIAAMVDAFAKALHSAQIGFEILGFSTQDWYGGKVMKAWEQAGKPNNPGRLNAVRHTIYKAANTPWRRSRRAIASLLKSDLFKEGVDGEALEWAASRLRQRREPRKIIMVISDGSPMDTATAANNHERYLDQHLAFTANAIEQDPNIQLCALGIGLDLSPYYQQSLAINLNDELQTCDHIELAKLLGKAV